MPTIYQLTHLKVQLATQDTQLGRITTAATASSNVSRPLQQLEVSPRPVAAGAQEQHTLPRQGHFLPGPGCAIARQHCTQPVLVLEARGTKERARLGWTCFGWETFILKTMMFRVVTTIK